MPDQRYTIIIVPHASSNLRKLHISARFVFSVFIGLAVVILAGIGTMVHYVKLNLEVESYQRVQMDNEQLKTSLAEAQALTQKLNRKISILTDLSNKLRVMAGLPMKDADTKQQIKLGMGGVWMDPAAGGGPDPQKLLSLQQRADYLEKSLGVLKNYFQDKAVALDSTPSVLPAPGFVSSTFGSRQNPFTNAPDFHEGLDISNEVGTPVIAPADGVCVFVGEKGGFGQVVEIRHDDSVTTLFGHLEKILVKPGQKIKRWQKIGLMGNSGRSTGPHLHYEVHVNDQPVNPLPYILNLDSIAG
jgi:murein DD-endopeptidase MepM/ murein hydrolase activator NlpD